MGYLRNLEVHIQASDKTMDEGKFEDSWEGDPQLNNIDLASGQLPSNIQSIKMQQIIPQQTVQDQHNNCHSPTTTTTPTTKQP